MAEDIIVSNELAPLEQRHLINSAINKHWENMMCKIMVVILQTLSSKHHTIELPLTNTSWNQTFLLLLFQCNHNFSQLKQFNYHCSVANDNHKSLVGLIYMKKLMSKAHFKSCIINWLWQRTWSQRKLVTKPLINITVLFTNMRILKFKSRLHNCVFRCRQSS